MSFIFLLVCGVLFQWVELLALSDIKIIYYKWTVPGCVRSLAHWWAYGLGKWIRGNVQSLCILLSLSSYYKVQGAPITGCSRLCFSFLKIEPKTLSTVGKHSTTWAIPPAQFYFLIQKNLGSVSLLSFFSPLFLTTFLFLFFPILFLLNSGD
jgi:hypothetical protein